MAYYINGEKVSKEEFLKGSKGIDFDNPPTIYTHSFQPFQSPIDGKIISNTKELREHERHYKVKQCGNDFSNLTKKEKGND